MRKKEKARTRKELSIEVARMLNMSSDDVDDIVYAYYSFIYDQVISLNHMRINLNELGILEFRPKMANKFLKLKDYKIDYIYKIKNEELREERLREFQDVEQKLMRLIEISHQENEKRYEIKKYNISVRNNMGQQNTDTEWDIQADIQE